MKDVKNFNKLVRDLIPELIEDKGEKVEVKILDQSTYRAALLEKVLEEGRELQAAPSIEEVADVLEVLDSICTEFGFSKEAVEKYKEEKKGKRGGFSQKKFLVKTYRD